MVTVGAGAVTVTVVVGAICVALVVPPRLLGMAAARMLNAERSNKESAGRRASMVLEGTVSWSAVETRPSSKVLLIDEHAVSLGESSTERFLVSDAHWSHLRS